MGRAREGLSFFFALSVVHCCPRHCFGPSALRVFTDNPQYIITSVVFFLNLLEWLTSYQTGEIIFTMLVSMLPIVELRGGVPFGTALGLSPLAALCAGVVGNLLPIPFIIVYIRRIFQWMRRRFPRLNRMVDRLERKAHLKGRSVSRYKYLGLYIFVAIPLPGTGAWTGALAAAFLDMPLRKALPPIILGVITAGMIMTFATGFVVDVILPAAALAAGCI